MLILIVNTNVKSSKVVLLSFAFEIPIKGGKKRGKIHLNIKKAILSSAYNEKNGSKKKMLMYQDNFTQN